MAMRPDPAVERNIAFQDVRYQASSCGQWPFEARQGRARCRPQPAHRLHAAQDVALGPLVGVWCEGLPLNSRQVGVISRHSRG